MIDTCRTRAHRRARKVDEEEPRKQVATQAMTKDSEGQLPKLQLQELRNAESASDVVHLAFLLIQRRGIRKLKYFLHEFKNTLQGPLIFCKARLLSRRRV